MKKQIVFIGFFIVFLFSGISYANTDTKILIVLTSHSELGNTGKKTGFWLPELTHPYYAFTDAGFEVDVASPQGGMAPLDAKALEENDKYNDLFFSDATLMKKVISSIALSEIKPEDYSVILFSGGSGPMWDFPNNPEINRIAASIYENNGIVSAVCHGGAALTNITLSNNELLIKNKRVAAFTNEEEESLGTAHIVPFLLQDKLIEQGAQYVEGKAWQANIVVDGRLITGQNPASATPLAKAIIKQLQQNK